MKTLNFYTKFKTHELKSWGYFLFNRVFVAEKNTFLKCLLIYQKILIIIKKTINYRLPLVYLLVKIKNTHCMVCIACLCTAVLCAYESCVCLYFVYAYAF